MKTNEKLPLYCKLAEIIEDKIEEGYWRKGDKIPSERELVDIYDVSRITVRNSINELVRQGRLKKIQGKGTYVIGNSIVQNLGNFYSFSREMEEQGRISSTKIIVVEVEKSNKKIALELGIKEGQEVIYIERLRCADNVPIMLEKTYFKKEDYIFLLDVDLNNLSLYYVLENEYGVCINGAIETFKACELNPYECEKLLCKSKQYGLLVRRTSFCGERVICYSTIVSKGDSFEFTVKLESK